jgi:hypothetical protein
MGEGCVCLVNVYSCLVPKNVAEKTHEKPHLNEGLRRCDPGHTIEFATSMSWPSGAENKCMRMHSTIV